LSPIAYFTRLLPDNDKNTRKRDDALVRGAIRDTVPSAEAVGANPQNLRRGSDASIIGVTPRQPKVLSTVTSLKQLWSDLYNKHHCELVHYLQGKWRKEPDEASDIVHQAFERFMSVAEPSRIEQPRAYLFQLVRNLAVDAQRRDKVRENHARQETLREEPAAADTQLQSVLAGEQLKALQKVIEKMPAKRRRAFVLNRVYQVGYREIADEMGISTDGVKKHILRALETCHLHLQSRFDDEKT
jgi:RNA polymerase sigma-19 factor, ECF subfamily